MSLSYGGKEMLVNILFYLGVIFFLAGVVFSVLGLVFKERQWLAMIAVGYLILSSFLLIHPSFSARIMKKKWMFIAADSLGTITLILTLLLRILV
jgi:hypothetical protein